MSCGNRGAYNSDAVPTKPNTSANLNSISIVNTDTAFIGGNGVILKTINGVDWTSLNVYKPEAQLLKYGYQYDDGGNITTETVNASDTNLYRYNNDNQLTSWTSTAGVETDWFYDASGNRGTQTVAGGPTTTYQYGADNRLASSTTGGQTTGYDYDNNGNLWQKTAGADTTTYAFSSDNELTSISSSGTTATFTYDAEGKRTAKTVNGVTTQFVYDGIKLIAEKDASGAITATYFYDANGKLVSMKKNGQSYYFHLNHRGDVVSITDASQTVAASYRYDPWGNILDSTGTFANSQPFRCVSYYWDKETGLYYLMARYYEPTLGRFISKDVFLRLKEAPKAQLKYAYATNNPIMNVDPDGEFAIALPVLIIGGVLAVAAYIAWVNNPDTQAAISLLQDNIEANLRDTFALLAKANKRIKKGINSKLKRIEEHLEKIKNNPNSQARKKWEKEIDNFRKQIDKKLKK